MPIDYKKVLKKARAAYADVEREVVKDNEIVSEVIDEKLQEQVVRQVNDEYDLSFKFNEGKRQKALMRLKLLNNQRRDEAAVGDPLMFTIFYTVMASIWDDRLQQTWEGRGGSGDEDVEENLNAMSNYDYDIMEKAELDYFWDWDACFFGRGLMLMMEFDRDEMCPVPELIDAATFIRDPKAKSVNGYGKRGEGAMRFGGWPIGGSYWELKEHPAFFNVSSLRKDKEVVRSLIDEAREARAEAQGNDPFYPQEEALRKFDNYEFQLLNWVTHIKGKKYLVTLGNRRTLLVRMIDLSKHAGRWPIEDRALYPSSNDWDGISLPDLTEDKQRARALLQNLTLKSAKADVMPQYLFDRTRIKNKNDLNMRNDKFIGVDGRVDNAIIPMQKATIHQHSQLIMDALKQAAEAATASPESQQGVPQSQQRTLGEINLVSSKVDTRYSLTAKLFGLSEKRFWNQWYRLYKIYFKDGIDTKVIRIQGALAPVWRELTRENITSSKDPDVRIESKVISEAKRQREQQSFLGYASLALQEPTTNRRYILRRLGKLNSMSKEELDMAFPKTVDEMQAEDENILLNNNKIPPINIRENHMEHIMMHAKANQTPATMAHIKKHREAMVIKRSAPELFPDMQQPQVKPVTDQRAGVQNRPAPTSPTQ